MSKREVTYTISVADRASAGFRKVAEGSRKARKEVEGLERAAEEAGDAIDENLDGDSVEELSEELDKAKRKTRQLGEEAKESGRGFEGMAKSAKGMVKALAAAAVTKFFVKQGKEAVDAAAQIETYQATLETMLGSRQAARDRMEEYKDVAKITPFEMSEVVEAGNQLQAIGRYSRKNLEMLGDLAAASGKPMEQVMNAYAKLATGQKGEASRMFQDLLISRQDWIAATGKGVSKSGELLATTEEMMKALPKIMSSKGFYGMMAKQAETTTGKISNLEDAVFSLRAAIGERMAPTVKGATTWLGKMAESMERAVRIPLEQKIAAEKAELNMLVGALADTWDKEDDRRKIIDELNSKYPDFLKNVNLEKEGLEGVRTKLVQVNAEYDKRIKKAVMANRLEKLQEEDEEAYNDYLSVVMSQNARARNQELLKQMGLSNELDADLSIHHDDQGYYHWQSYKDRWNGIHRRKVYHSQITPELWEEYQANKKFYVRDSDSRKAKLEANHNRIKGEMETMQRLAGVDDGESEGGQNGGDGKNGTNGTTNGGGDGTTTVGGTTYSGGGSGGSGGGGGKTVTTHIGTLVGTIEIHTTTLQESTEEVKSMVTQALLEAVPSDLG